MHSQKYTATALLVACCSGVAVNSKFVVVCGPWIVPDVTEVTSHTTGIIVSIMSTMV